MLIHTPNWSVICANKVFYNEKHDPWHWVNGRKLGFICQPCYILSNHAIVRFLDLAKATFVQLSFSFLFLFIFYIVIKRLHAE